MAALFNLDADLSGPMSAIGLAIDACSQNKQNKSILDCEEDLLLSCFLQETKVPKNSNIDRSALLGNNDLQLKLFEGLSPPFFTAHENVGCQLVEYLMEQLRAITMVSVIRNA